MSTTPNPVRSTVARITSVEQLMSSFDRVQPHERYDRAWMERFAPHILNRVVQIHGAVSVESHSLRYQLTVLARRHGPRRLSTLAKRSGIPIDRLRSIFALHLETETLTFSEAAAVAMALGVRLRLRISSQPCRRRPRRR